MARRKTNPYEEILGIFNRCRVKDCDEKPFSCSLCFKHYEEQFGGRNRQSYVYAVVAQDIEPQKVKFGISVNPESRLCGIQTGCPVKVYLWGVVKGGKRLEGVIHGFLEDCHSHGEWFDLRDNALRVAELIRQGNKDGVHDLVEPNRKLSFEEKLAAI